MSELESEMLKRFETMVVDTCDRIFTEAVRKMRSDIEFAGLQLTDALKNSLYAERAFVTDQLEAHFRMGMRGYGRFKDMRQISFARFPNVEALKEYIEDIGVGKFINNDSVTINGKSVQLYVPGYHIGRKKKKEITAERAYTRIAYGIGRSMIDKITIKRAKKGGFYNVNKGEVYSEIGEYLMTKLPQEFIKGLKEYYERPFFEKGGYWE